MYLVKWNPMNEMMSLRNHVNRMFDDTFFPARGLGREELAACNWNPAVDVYEDDDAYVVSAELPGMNKEDIVVDLNGRVLTLKGERNSEKEAKEYKYYRRERTYGKFQRAFTLPEAIDPEKIAAEFKEGVLRISIPKPEERKPKQITVH